MSSSIRYRFNPAWPRFTEEHRQRREGGMCCDRIEFFNSAWAEALAARCRGQGKSPEEHRREAWTEIAEMILRTDGAMDSDKGMPWEDPKAAHARTLESDGAAESTHA